jgi:hypothetical protein
MELVGSSTLGTGNRIERCDFAVNVREGGNDVVLDTEMLDCASMMIVADSRVVVDGGRLSSGCDGVRGLNGEVDLRNTAVTDLTGYPLYVSGSPVTVSGCTIQGCQRGMWIEFTPDTEPVLVTGSLLDSLGFGIELHYTRETPVLISHNTINAVRGYGVKIGFESRATIQNNIVTASYGGISCSDTLSSVIECNNIFDTTHDRYGGNCADQTGLAGNISVDPMYCGTGLFGLRSGSPCAPGGHPDGVDCGLIGAFPVCE